MPDNNTYTATSYVRMDLRYERQKDHTYPIILVVYHNYVKRKYKTSFRATKEEWELSQSLKKSKIPKIKLLKSQLKEIENESDRIIETISDNFSFDKFEKLYLGDKAESVKNQQDVYNGFQNKIDESNDLGKFGTAGIYKDAMICLIKRHKILKYGDITYQFLKELEHFMLSHKYSISTVALYMRCLRHIYKRAIRAKLILKKQFPFGKSDDDEEKYIIPSPEDNKRALDEKDLIKILNYQPTWESEAKAFALWRFCFFCNGMNAVDAFNLKYEQFNNGFLDYVRQKTASTTKQRMTIHIYHSSAIQNIVDEWGNQDRRPDNYVFDIFNQKQTPKEQFDTRKRYIRVINDRMQDIAKKLGITAQITTMVARHTWATTLMRRGLSTTFIQKGFGHTSITTTEKYLGDFTTDQKKDAAIMLANLIK